MNHESRLQIVVVGYLNSVLPKGAVFWSVPNGGRKSIAGHKMANAMGQLPGASDLMVLWLGRLHCIELKVKKDPVHGIPRTTKQSAAQVEFQIAVEAMGAPYAVCRSTLDVRDALIEWGIPIKEKPGQGSNPDRA